MDHHIMDKALVNYFTCTLGQAAALSGDKHQECENINQFIDRQARQYAGSPAVGFPVVSNQGKDWEVDVFSFGRLRHQSLIAARKLKHLINDNDSKKSPSSCIALICPSSSDFLLTWLGLIRLGHSVLLIAPQCLGEATAHLCNACSVSVIIYHNSYVDTVLEAVRHSTGNLTAKELPSALIEPELHGNEMASLTEFDDPKLVSESVAYIHHTSGTSTGLPKPTPQTHKAAIGVLPCIPQSLQSTFTTTPLYHGGVADCFRAWTSADMIWLFPGGDAPITQRNIVASLDAIERYSELEKLNLPKQGLKYFSSVPYILQMMAEDPHCLSWLKKMGIVGVGGAALPQSIGDRLVSEGVNLVSRFGSAECGFLLSSHRDYSVDREWQYLRHQDSQVSLSFEKQSDSSGLSELIVPSNWPHMAKRNRDDGSFATSDLFEPHLTIPGAWKYHSRSDSQITLVTGKKFDPAPVEDAMVAAIPEVSDVLIFGNGKDVPGAVMILSDEVQELDDRELKHRIWKVVDEVNREGQNHTRISKDMILLSRERRLEKTSKGTVLRNVANQRFAAEIEAVYSSGSSNGEGTQLIANGSVRVMVIDVVYQVLGKHIDFSDDFYVQGVDSANCTRIRTLLQRIVREVLPWNVVYDCKNIDGLIEYLESAQDGTSTNGVIDDVKDMTKLSALYSMFPLETIARKPQSDNNGHVILLTGATGALGAHILSQLLKDPSIHKVICLVRASDSHEAHHRVIENLKWRHLMVSVEDCRSRIQCLASQFQEESLGLSESEFMDLKRTITSTIHTAWPVNFSLPLSAFKASLQGLQGLLKLSQSCPRCKQFLFCSSTASIISTSTSTPIPELISTNPNDSDKLGYSRSKWVAEAICNSFAKEQPQIDVKVVRIGQLTGDSKYGIWNMSEAYPLLLSTVKQLGSLPLISDPLDWLPLDTAALAIVQILNSKSSKIAQQEPGQNTSHDAEVYHVLNPHGKGTPDFGDLLQWFKDMMAEHFEIVDPDIWLDRLEALEEHDAKALLGLWRKAYGSQDKSRKIPVCFQVDHAKEVSTAMENVRPVDRILVERIWNWLQEQI